MVTRSVVSLACGVPVVHPPFTEVSAMISEYDAGWLVDPLDDGAVGAALDEVMGDPETVRRKRENARALALEVLDPAEAVKPLVEILGEL
jgi:glycosyltransferase involved in cell wall biosynthesis